jgi:hypothetical protein
MVPSLAEATLGRKKRGEAMEGVVVKIETGGSMRIGWFFVAREYLLDNGLIEE